MNVCKALRTAVIVVLVGFLFPAATLLAEDFRASGSDAITASYRNQRDGVVDGRAQPGGRFTGAWTGQFKGYAVIGVETWNFGGGDTLTWAFVIRYSNKNLISTGTYVVIDGTGRYAGASGSADYLRTGNGDGTGEFLLEGTLTLP